MCSTLHIFCIPDSLKWSLCLLFFFLLFKQNSWFSLSWLSIPGRASLTLIQVLSGYHDRVLQFAVEGGALRAAVGIGQARNVLVECICL